MAAVATRSTVDSSHLGSKTSSPKDSKKSLPVKAEDSQSSAGKAEDSKASGDSASKTTTTNAEPLAPPPKPATSDGDYFSTNHNNGSSFNLEPNPFEQSFGNPSAETPGKNLLPSVASLTSPSSLLPGGTPNWSNSLRSGPLSPAMLAGPTGANDYFGDSHFRGGFPTPNESSLRTGLTPGGGGSMFPAPSPGSQAFLNSLQSGGATPGTLDFHRTAMTAAAKSVQQNFNNTSGAGNSNNTTQTSQAPDSNMESKGNSQNQTADSYHDANDAANGLFMLAQANGGRSSGSFAVPGQPAQSANASAANQGSEASPSKRGGKNSIASAESVDMSDDETSKPSTRSRGKKNNPTPKSAAANRRKAEDTPSKPPASKKAKSNSGEPKEEDYSSMDDEGSPPNESGKKMTDEEKRKNFLERNRVAALKCRQRKKQWLASLQAKVEYYTAENEALNGQLGQLREEVMNLKTILLSHKDCPITHQQGLNGMTLANLLGDPGQHAHPYGMGMQNGVPNNMSQQGFSMPGGPPNGMHRR